MSCPHRQRRCKHALSAASAAMYMYSVVQQSVANGEDEEWDEASDDDDPDEASDLAGVIDEEHEALEELEVREIRQQDD